MMEKTYQLTFEERDNYLYAHLTGQDSFGASLSYWNKIADKVTELAATRLLIHEDLIGNVTEAEIFDVVADLLGSGLVGIRIALFDANSNDTPLNALGQLMANNRGGKVKLFKTLDAAQQWIVKDD